MIFFSEIARPPYTFKLEKPEWNKGEKIDGFTFPYNFYGDAYTLFSRFTLWMSAHGINKPGINYYCADRAPKFVRTIKGRDNIKVFRRVGNSITIRNPLLTGDTVDGDGVTWAYSRYLPRQQWWICDFMLGELPEPQVHEQIWGLGMEKRSAYMKNIQETIQSAYDMTFKILQEFHLKIMMAPLSYHTAMGEPVIPTPNMVALSPVQLESIKAKYDVQLKLIMQKLEASEWR